MYNGTVPALFVFLVSTAIVKLIAAITVQFFRCKHSRQPQSVVTVSPSFFRSKDRNLPKTTKNCRSDVLQLLDGLAAAAVQVYPAVSISMAYINDSDVATRHHGGALVATPDDSSIYQVGSITKTFTSTLLAVAVAEGVVELTTPVKV